MTPLEGAGLPALCDWNEIWKHQVEQNELEKGGSDYQGLWKDRSGAERFFKRSEGPSRDHNRITKTLANLPIARSSRILDIGAGPGSLAIPMAKRGVHVTAVEPADGMADILEERIQNEGLTNIQVIRKAWEDCIPKELGGPFDITIASYSLGMKDLRQAIKSMENATRGTIALYWFASETPWEQDMAALWPVLHGRPYAGMPKCDILYNVLYQMGIFPNAVVFPIEYHDKYRTLEEALDHYRERLRAGSNHDAILRRFCERRLIQVPDGYTIRETSMRVKFWWDTRILQSRAPDILRSDARLTPLSLL